MVSNITLNWKKKKEKRTPKVHKFNIFGQKKITCVNKLLVCANNVIFPNKINYEYGMLFVWDKYFLQKWLVSSQYFVSNK